MTDEPQKPDITPLALKEAMEILQKREWQNPMEIPAKERSWLELSEQHERLNLAAEEAQMKAASIRERLDLAKERPTDRTLPRAPQTVAKLEKQIETLHQQTQHLAEEALALRPGMEELGSLRSSTGDNTIAENAEHYRKQFVSAQIVEAEISAELSAQRDVEMRKDPRAVEYSRRGETITIPYGGKGHAKAAVQWTENTFNAASEDLELSYRRGAEVGVTGEDIHRARVYSFNAVAHRIEGEVNLASHDKPMKGELANEYQQVYKLPELLGEKPPKYQPTEKQIRDERNARQTEMMLRARDARSSDPSLGLSLGLSLSPPTVPDTEVGGEGDDPTKGRPSSSRSRKGR